MLVYQYFMLNCRWIKRSWRRSWPLKDNQFMLLNMRHISRKSQPGDMVVSSLPLPIWFRLSSGWRIIIPSVHLCALLKDYLWYLVLDFQGIKNAELFNKMAEDTVSERCCIQCSWETNFCFAFEVLLVVIAGFWCVITNVLRPLCTIQKKLCDAMMESQL